jgi:hypothetical protein
VEEGREESSCPLVVKKKLHFMNTYLTDIKMAVTDGSGMWGYEMDIAGSQL